LGPLFLLEVGVKIKVLDKWLAHGVRPRGVLVNTIVVHATAGGNVEGAISTLKERGLSYHYIISPKGEITKLAPTTGEAWHAGVSVGPQGPSVNRYSIGIALVNMNDGKDPYEAPQMAALEWLIQELRPAMDAFTYLTTHAAISYPRKNDPYKLDLRPLAAKVGLKFWVGKQPW
jgi:N-acetylmuramoyl-L-alanine amidase